MRRIILVLAMLALLVIMALPAVAQSGYDDYGRGYDDDYDDRGYNEDPRDPQCGWYPNWDDRWEWWEYWCFWPNWGWEFVFWSW